MKFCNKRFFNNTFYIKLKIYSCFLVFNFFTFDNVLFTNINLNFINNNINISFIKNTLINNLLILNFQSSIFNTLIYFFSFNLFFLLNFYFSLPINKKFFFVKFGYFCNKYYNKYKLYLFFFSIKNNLILFFNSLFKKKISKIFFLLNFFKNYNKFNKKSIEMNINEILNIIENLTILQLNDLLKSFDEKYSSNISLSDNSSSDKDIKETSSYSIYLSKVGVSKIAVIKLVREINNLGLKESKDLVELSPVLIKENIDLNTAEMIKKRFDDIGALIEIK